MDVRGNLYRAGVGRMIITPPLSVPHASWGAQTHIFAEGIESDLWCTVLLVEDRNEMVAFVDIDLSLFTPAEAEAIRAEVAAAVGIAGGKVRVATTHNHARLKLSRANHGTPVRIPW